MKANAQYVVKLALLLLSDWPWHKRNPALEGNRRLIGKQFLMFLVKRDMHKKSSWAV
jgi:hypothetical protein